MRGITFQRVLEPYCISWVIIVFLEFVQTSALTISLTSIFFCPWTSAPSCNAPAIPKLSYVTSARGSQSRYLDGEKVYYSCHSGYELVGIPEVECQDGVWTQTMFQCERKLFICFVNLPLKMIALVDNKYDLTDWERLLFGERWVGGGGWCWLPDTLYSC